MSDKTNKIKTIKNTSKKVLKDTKSALKTAAAVKKGVGVGLKVLEQVSPEKKEKVLKKIDEAQEFLEKRGQPIEKFVDKAQKKLDEVIGDKLEAKVEMWEHKFQEKGGNKIEHFIEKTITAIDTSLNPLVKQGAKLTVDTAKVLGAKATPLVKEVGKKVGKALETAASEAVKKIKKK